MSSLFVVAVVFTLAGFMWGLTVGHRWSTQEKLEEARNYRHNQAGSLDIP